MQPTFGPDDTDDLRHGPELNDRLLALLPLVGTWSGTGVGVSTVSGAEFRFTQRARFTHDGRPFLAYESRSWLVDDDGALIRPAWRESGFWRAGAGQDDVEVMLGANTGLSLVYAGVAGELRWTIETTAITPAATARTDVDAERRLYAIVDGQLRYATELAVAGAGLRPHLNGDLSRES